MENKTRKAKDWIKQQFAEVGRLMQIGMYEFHFVYNEEAQGSASVEGLEVLLAIRPINTYKRASVFISPHALEMAKGNRQDREHLLDAIIHEVCHIHTGPLGDLANRRYVSEQEIRDKVEEVTEAMANYARQSLRATSTVYRDIHT